MIDVSLSLWPNKKAREAVFGKKIHSQITNDSLEKSYVAYPSEQELAKDRKNLGDLKKPQPPVTRKTFLECSTKPRDNQCTSQDDSLDQVRSAVGDPLGPKVPNSPNFPQLDGGPTQTLIELETLDAGVKPLRQSAVYAVRWVLPTVHHAVYHFARGGNCEATHGEVVPTVEYRQGSGDNKVKKKVTVDALNRQVRNNDTVGSNAAPPTAGTSSKQSTDSKQKKTNFSKKNLWPEVKRGIVKYRALAIPAWPARIPIYDTHQGSRYYCHENSWQKLPVGTEHETLDQFQARMDDVWLNRVGCRY